MPIHGKLNTASKDIFMMKCSFRNPDGEGYVRSVNVLEPNAWMDKVYDII